MDLYWTLVFLHVIAFAYWLGGDFGVYVTGGYVARAANRSAARGNLLIRVGKACCLVGWRCLGCDRLGCVCTAWRVGFMELQRGPSESAERLIAQGIQRGRRGAWVFWAVIALTAYLGVAKPF